MIKNVLIPEKIGNHYLFAKRIVGFHIDNHTVNATQLYLKGSTFTIEQTFSETVSVDEELAYDESVSKTIQKILQTVGKYDAVYTAMSGAQVIFKTLKLPFTTYEKIKMVVSYEVEPLLPFSLDEAVLDFIVTKQNSDEGSSEVIVAAVQKSVIAEQISFFEQIGVHPQKVSVDLFELYNLYNHIPEYTQFNGNAVLLDIGASSTRLAFIQKDRLTAVRVLPHGVNKFASFVAKQFNVAQENALDMIFQHGVGGSDEKISKALQEVLKEFWAKVQFSLSSFVGQQELRVDRYIFSGKGAKIAGLVQFFESTSSTSCQLFETKQLFASGQIKLKSTANLSVENLTSLGLVLPSETTEYFNLLPKHMSVERDVSLLTKQIVFAGLFFVLLLGALLTHSVLQSRKLKREIAASKEDVVEVLQERFDVPRDKEDFDDVVDEAQRIVAKEESIWAPFTEKSQFLKYLLELMNTLDTEDLGLEVDRLAIAPGIMTLKARVKDFPSVAKFENELRRSKLFKYTGSAQKTDFTMKIPLTNRR